MVQTNEVGLEQIEIEHRQARLERDVAITQDNRLELQGAIRAGRV